MWCTNAETINIWTQLEDGTYVYLDTINTRRRMTIEVTDELLELVESYKHYSTEYGAINIARYICDELDKEEEE